MAAKFFCNGRHGFGGSLSSGVWWIRIFDYLVHVKAPRSAPLFSERYGKYWFRLSLDGWRMIAKKPRE